ncbi:hypothetical protein AB0H86_28920 [Streptomyces sp. NPDC050997]|uniref:hypothetical protein n=1 Tax=Streptomyces sp. NPDC050997 TaxID=3155519 RepID=UPI003444ADC9
MASSPEHDFLSAAALRIMESASRSRLFGYAEGQRKLFDFSCDLKRDWSKVVVGQTLWQHGGDGIDKDLRTFLNEEDIHAAIYIARHESRHRTRLTEVTQSYLRGPLRDRLSRLRVFWVPVDFDAGNEHAQESIYNILKDEITKDLLLHVALGGLTPQDVARFASSRRPGLPIAILSHVKKSGYRNHRSTAKALDVNLEALKYETERLFIIGFLGSESLQGGMYHVTDSGNAMLDICSRLRDYLRGKLGEGNENKEFEHISKILGIEYSAIPITARLVGNGAEVDIQDPTALLLQHVAQAAADGAVDWPDPYFQLPSGPDISASK